MNKNTKVGKLHDFSETGTEGIIFLMYTGDFTETHWDWKYSIAVEVDDYLKILDERCETVIWEGIVKYDRTNFEKPVGYDETISFEDWLRYFMEGRMGILTKHE